MRLDDYIAPYSSSLSGLNAVNAVTSAAPTSRKSLPKIVSLFSGAGGLDLGFKEVGFSISVAIDASDAAIRTHRKNFPRTKSIVADLDKLGPEGVTKIVRERLKSGERIAVIGGPPCQGFSRANACSYSDDPRNKLPDLYLQIIKELQRNYTVEFVVFENVLGIRDRKHADTYGALLKGLDSLGFSVTEKELCALDYGVPQNRRRIILSCMRSGQGYTKVIPRKCHTGPKTVRDVIGGLDAPAFFARSLRPEDIPVHRNHWTMRPKSKRFTHPAEFATEGRSFRRLDWDAASPTIAFGHREIHVHPDGRRRLSIFEAMLIQGFPKTFVLEGNLSEQVEQISNAVPPPLARRVALAVKQALKNGTRYG